MWECCDNRKILPWRPIDTHESPYWKKVNKNMELWGLEFTTYRLSSQPPQKNIPRDQNHPLMVGKAMPRPFLTLKKYTLECILCVFSVLIEERYSKSFFLISVSPNIKKGLDNGSKTCYITYVVCCRNNTQGIKREKKVSNPIDIRLWMWYY